MYSGDNRRWLSLRLNWNEGSSNFTEPGYTCICFRFEIHGIFDQLIIVLLRPGSDAVLFMSRT